MRGEKRVKRYREAALTGEIWRAIGDRSWGREKRNEQYIKGRRNCGAEGIDKIVIVQEKVESRFREVTY